ncbi:MAG: response regulator transcription factor [Saprospiraceae bacterium]|nr:response regulator transcription factor [Saprospiraceae bacterium]
MKIAILEDEKLVAKDLTRTLHDIDPSIEILAYIESVEDGLEFFKNIPEVDLIFSDIQLGDGLSFEIFEKTKNQTPIVFCTAFNQYAIEAFKTIGIDYILKPITKANVEKALTKFETLKSNFKSESLPLEKLFDVLKYQLQPTKIPSVIIHQGDKIIPLDGEKIALFFIENGIVFAYTFEQKKMMVNKKLDILEDQFTPHFFRVNRQFLVQRKAVKEASQYFHRKLLVVLNVPFKDEITVGKEKVTEFLNWLVL